MSQDISTELLCELIAITSGADNDKPRAPAKMIDLNSALLELKRRREIEANGICQLNAGTIAHIERLAGMPYDEWVDWCHSIKPPAAPKEAG